MPKVTDIFSLEDYKESKRLLALNVIIKFIELNIEI
jgi:hypothetical protein